MSSNIRHQLKQLESIKDILTTEEYNSKRSDILKSLMSSSNTSSTSSSSNSAVIRNDDNDDTVETETTTDSDLLNTIKDTVGDKKFLVGGGLGFVAGAAAGAAGTTLYQKYKDKKNKKKKNDGVEGEEEYVDDKLRKVIHKKIIDNRGYVGLYTGTVSKKSSEPEGFGLIVYNCDGAQYVGQWVDGWGCGQGKIMYPDNERYEGGVRNDEPHGYGSLYDNVDECIYRGEWSYGKQHGKGESFNPENGSSYKGDFKNSQEHGQGVYIFPPEDENEDRIQYIGSFKNDNFNGYGTLTYKDGHVYRGDFKDSWRHGKGITTDPDGQVSGPVKFIEDSPVSTKEARQHQHRQFQEKWLKIMNS